MKRELTLRHCKVTLGDDGICRFDYLPNSEVTYEDAEEIIAAYMKLSDGKRVPIYADANKIKSFDRDARNYLASDDFAAHTSAVAILVGTPLSKVLGNFYLGVQKPATPTRLFSTEDAALAWLTNFVA